MATNCLDYLPTTNKAYFVQDGLPSSNPTSTQLVVHPKLSHNMLLMDDGYWSTTMYIDVVATTPRVVTSGFIQWDVFQNHFVFQRKRRLVNYFIYLFIFQSHFFMKGMNTISTYTIPSSSCWIFIYLSFSHSSCIDLVINKIIMYV